MRSPLLVVVPLLVALSGARSLAQPADPNDDGLGTHADFSTVTVGPLPAEADPADTDRLLAAHPADGTKRGISLISTIDTRSHLYPVHDQLEKFGGINATLSYVGSWLDIPADLRVIFGQCRQKNAFYSPRHQAIVFCYELVATFAEYFRDEHKLTGAALGRAVVGATVFALLHELGHAFSHLFGFPMLGNEEDSADRIAALLLLEEGDVGVNRAYAGAFGMLALDDGSKPAWFDEHSVGPQRYHNIMCLLVGADPKNLELVTDANFKKHRAPRCEGEFVKTRASLDVLLVPHYKKAVSTSRLDTLRGKSRLEALLAGPDDEKLEPLLVIERKTVTPAALVAPAGGWPDPVAWKLAHLDRVVTLLEQSEGRPDAAVRDVQRYYVLNQADFTRLAAATDAASVSDYARHNQRHEVGRSDLQKRLIALSRRSPALVSDARITRALDPLL